MVIDPRFVYLAMLLGAVGGYGYVRATLRGVTFPNRVTWSLRGLEGVLAFGVEIQIARGPGVVDDLDAGTRPLRGRVRVI